MAGYISESFKYFEIAEGNLNNFTDNKNAFVCIVFSAMYIESVINDIIFTEKFTEKLVAEYRKEPLDDQYDFDLYQDKVSINSKLDAIFRKYSFINFKKDKEYVELVHLISIRNALVHLKPLEQNNEGVSKIQTAKAKKALNYLNKGLKIISSPFDVGVYWTDTLMNKDVANWAINVSKKTVSYLYKVTQNKSLFGNQHLLVSHLMRLGLDFEINKKYDL